MLPALWALLAALTAQHAVSALDSTACAVCYKAWNKLSRVLNDTKTELERSKEFNDKKAQKVDKVQKAQTKRWLKNEYRVALRAGIEDELEQLCSRDVMNVSPEMKTTCLQFMEAHEDNLPRALLDEKQVDPFCANHVPGCEGKAAEDALSQHAVKKARSEKPPKNAKTALVRGCVQRLVGTTYGKATRAKAQHVLVLVHNGSATKGSREASDVRYSSLIAEFYAFATAVNKSLDGSGADRFMFAQMDTSKNDLPARTTSSDPKGVSVLIYLIGETGNDPQSLPPMGEKPLLWAEPAAVRSQLTQLLLTYLPAKDQGLVRKVMQAREKESASSSDGPDSEGSSDATSASAASNSGADGGGDESSSSRSSGESEAGKAKPPPPPPRRKKASVDKAAAAQVREQSCDTCVLVIGELEAALNATKAEMERSKDYNDRKAQKVDKVQKAQTKRWLKNEYKVELAASVEERLEKACSEENRQQLLEAVCADDVRSGVWDGLAKDGKKKAKLSAHHKACEAAGQQRCKELVEEHAEVLTRSVLDGKSATSCATILRGCEPRLALLATEAAEKVSKASSSQVEKDEV